ncbi:uncharacterized protein LOC111053042 [Nilaparvata lugens]|uniref:uncharacterized protein LOC111053042 n=1 Tax=Nilaparvata lugens TaxID=108931 RepID=UPI00193DEB97|nr:uncharacterized protein LOC111053042 [Nilaparvata lugens]
MNYPPIHHQPSNSSTIVLPSQGQANLRQVISPPNQAGPWNGPHVTSPPNQVGPWSGPQLRSTPVQGHPQRMNGSQVMLPNQPGPWSNFQGVSLVMSPPNQGGPWSNTPQVIQGQGVQKINAIQSAPLVMLPSNPSGNLQGMMSPPSQTGPWNSIPLGGSQTTPLSHGAQKSASQVTTTYHTPRRTNFHHSNSNNSLLFSNSSSSSGVLSPESTPRRRFGGGGGGGGGVGGGGGTPKTPCIGDFIVSAASKKQDKRRKRIKPTRLTMSAADSQSDVSNASRKSSDVFTGVPESSTADTNNPNRAANFDEERKLLKQYNRQKQGNTKNASKTRKETNNDLQPTANNSESKKKKETDDRTPTKKGKEELEVKEELNKDGCEEKKEDVSSTPTKAGKAKEELQMEGEDNKDGNGKKKENDSRTPKKKVKTKEEVTVEEEFNEMKSVEKLEKNSRTPTKKGKPKESSEKVKRDEVKMKENSTKNGSGKGETTVKVDDVPGQDKTFIRPDPSKVTNPAMLRKLAIVYCVLLDCNLVLNVTTEIHFVISLLAVNVALKRIDKPGDKSGEKTQTNQNVNVVCEETLVGVEKLESSATSLTSSPPPPVPLSSSPSVPSTLSPTKTDSRKEGTDVNELLSDVHNSVYFGCCVLAKQLKYLQLLDRKTLKLLAENDRIVLFAPSLKKKVAKLYSAKEVFVAHKAPASTGLTPDTICPVQFHQETDNRWTFSSDNSFATFRKQRDELYSILQAWSKGAGVGVAQGSSTSFAKVRGRVDKLLAMSQDPINVRHLAKHFCDLLLKAVATCEENIIKELENLPDVNKSKLSLLTKRLTEPSSEKIASPRPETSFPGFQQFYHDFLVIASQNFLFNVHLINCFVNEITVRSGASYDIDQSDGEGQVVQEETRQMFVQGLNSLCVLAKFLGLVVFAPYRSSSEISKSVLQEEITVRKQLAPPLNLEWHVNEAVRRGSLVYTVPWVVEYLAMMDSVAPHLPCYQPVLVTLYNVYTLCSPYRALSPSHRLEQQKRGNKEEKASEEEEKSEKLEKTSQEEKNGNKEKVVISEEGEEIRKPEKVGSEEEEKNGRQKTPKKKETNGKLKKTTEEKEKVGRLEKVGFEYGNHGEFRMEDGNQEIVRSTDRDQEKLGSKDGNQQELEIEDVMQGIFVSNDDESVSKDASIISKDETNVSNVETTVSKDVIHDESLSKCVNDNQPLSKEGPEGSKFVKAELVKKLFTDDDCGRVMELSPFTCSLLRLCLGWLFDSANFSQELINRVALLSDVDRFLVEKVQPTRNQVTMDSCSDLVTLEIVHKFCPYLKSFHALLARKNTAITLGSVKHVTPISSTGSLISSATSASLVGLPPEISMQLQMEDHFFMGQSESVKRTVEFVAERTASACIKEVIATVIVALKKKVSDSLQHADNKVDLQQLALEYRQRVMHQLTSVQETRLSVALQALLGPDVTSHALTLCKQITARHFQERVVNWLQSHINIQEILSKVLTNHEKEQKTSNNDEDDDAMEDSFEVDKLEQNKVNEEDNSSRNFSMYEVTVCSSTLIHIQTIVGDALESFGKQGMKTADETLELISDVKRSLKKCPSLAIKKQICIALLDYIILMISFRPAEVGDDVIDELMGVLLDGGVDDGKVWTQRNVMLLVQGGDATAAQQRLSRLTVALVAADLLSVARLEQQVVSLFRCIWPDNVLQMISEGVRCTVTDLKQKTRCDPEFLDLLSVIAADISTDIDYDL